MMSRLSVVIFGATGFTGKHAALELARLAPKHPGLTWGVAGRSQSKLEDLMRSVAEATAEDQSQVKIIVADVNDVESLKQMCSQARVVANCCGPYRLYGEAVVAAAVASGTHHVDVTGEPQFIETMQLKYNDAAREAGVYIISACGFDSIPNDMGVIFLQQNFGGTVNSVQSYLSASLPEQLGAEARRRGVLNRGTWESLVLGLAHWGDLREIRRQLYPAPLPPLRPKLMPQRVLHVKNKRWAVPFPGADNSVVYRTQRHLYEAGAGAGAGAGAAGAGGSWRPAQFKAYLQLESLMNAVGLMMAAVFLVVMTKCSWTLRLLLRHPRLLSCGAVSRAEGPPRAVSEQCRFQVELYADGWKEGTDITKPVDKTLVARVSGMNPGYGATVKALLFSALTVLEESDKMPGKGGVLTTGAAFKDTNLIKNLNENGLKFEIIGPAP